MSERHLTIGVHESGLARAQAEVVARELVARGVPYSVDLEIVEVIVSVADLHDDHIAENRSEIRRLHQLLVEGEIDVVIHRGFDLRGTVPDGLRLAAVLERGNPFDVLLAPFESGIDEMDEGQVVGVVQLRARAQLLDYRPDLQWDLVGGDVGSWLTSLIDGDLDALVAPGAAIEHLRLQERVSEIFPPELVIPAPGSGVLLCLCREDDELTAQRLRVLHDRNTSIEYTAECSAVESLSGLWEAPIGVLARLQGEWIEISAVVSSPDGSEILREKHLAAADDPCLAGSEIAALLLAAGAGELLDQETDEEQGEEPPCKVAGELPAAEAEWTDADDPVDETDFH